MEPDIIRFLNARLAEDAKRYQTIWLFQHAGRKRVDGWWDLGGALGYAVHDLADTTRGGREVAAKRRLIELHTPEPDVRVRDGRYVYDPPKCTVCTMPYPKRGTWQVYPCDVLRLLAFPYSSHPEYRDEWRLDA